MQEVPPKTNESTTTQSTESTNLDSSVSPPKLETPFVKETESHYKVRLPMWSGPMELLLELIRSSEIDINNISIARVTEDYLKTIETMKQMDIEVSSDFLVMGATLVLYKTRSLLGDTGELEDDTEHYKEALIQQVLTYEKYKNAANRLEKLVEQAPELMIEKAALTKRHTLAQQTLQSTEWVPVPLTELVAAFYRLTDRKEQSLEVDSFNEFYQKVNDKIESITDLLKGPKGLKGVPLSQIAKGIKQPALRSDLIATFIAMLELYKLARLEARQHKSFEEIYLFNNEARAVS